MRVDVKEEPYIVANEDDHPAIEKGNAPSTSSTTAQQVPSQFHPRNARKHARSQTLRGIYVRDDSDLFVDLEIKQEATLNVKVEDDFDPLSDAPEDVPAFERSGKRSVNAGRKCSKCRLTFKTKHALWSHMKYSHLMSKEEELLPHSTADPRSCRYYCDHCCVGFPEKKSLARHLGFWPILLHNLLETKLRP